MNCSACTARLSEYLDGELPAVAAGAIAQHLSVCAACHAELASLRAIRDGALALPKEISPPHDLWPGIEAAISGGESAPLAASPIEETSTVRTASATAETSRPSSAARWFVPLAIAASLAFVATVANRRAGEQAGRPGWAVAATAGAPRVNSTPIAAAGQLRPGQWLVTDADSRARVTVGEIGEVNIEPNSRLRLAHASATDHRLELARGELSAFIWAPPRLFFVDTPSATAVDLGCAYTLRVDDAGGSELRVSSGYVALEHAGRESIIPAGWMCLTRPGVGPGTPFRAETPAPWRQTLEQFDFEPAARESALERLIATAGPEDGVTWWHLLGRVEPAQRGAIFDVLARHHAPPAGVTRAGIVAGNRDMRQAWGAELGLAGFAPR